MSAIIDLYETYFLKDSHNCELLRHLTLNTQSLYNRYSPFVKAFTRNSRYRYIKLDSNTAPLSLPTSPRTPKTTQQARQRDIKLALASGLGYIAFYKVAALIPNNSMLVTAFTTLFAMCLLLLFTVTFVRSLKNATKALLTGMLFGCLLGLLKSRMAIGFNALLPGLDGVVMVGLAGSFGRILSTLFREMKMLLPAAVVLAMVDLYVVFGGGLVTQAQSGKSPTAAKAMKALTVELPVTQVKPGAAPIPLAIGFADFLFIAVFFSCFLRFGVPSRRTFVILTAFLVFYMLVVFVFGIPLPALVPMAVVFIGTNWRYFEYDRSEKYALLYAGLIVAVLFSYLLWKSNRPTDQNALPRPTANPSLPTPSP